MFLLSFDDLPVCLSVPSFLPSFIDRSVSFLSPQVGNMDVDAALEGNNAANERLLAELESGPAAYDPERGERPPPPAYNSQMRLGDGNNNVTSNGSQIVSGVNNLYEVRTTKKYRRIDITTRSARRRERRWDLTVMHRVFSLFLFSFFFFFCSFMFDREECMS